MWSSLILLAAFCTCEATDYTTSKFSSTYVKTSRAKLKMSLSMDKSENTVTLKLIGPSDVWFSVGFGNSEMASTYCVVVDGYGDVSERYLIEKTAGNELDDSWDIESNEVDGSSRTVILTRDYDAELPSSYHHTFSTSSQFMDTIWGYGTDADLGDHGKDKRGTLKLTAKRSKAKVAEVELYGAMTEDYMKESYESYLTTSSVLTWITCGVTLAIIIYFAYKKWYANKNYEQIPDNCQSNISMVAMGQSASQNQQPQVIV